MLWLPWIAWQARNGWPQLDVSRSIAAGNSTSSAPWWAVIPFQFLLQNSITMKFLFVYLMPQEQRARATAEITRMLEGGELVHNVAQSFELGDIVAAHEAVESGKALGNIVVRIA